MERRMVIERVRGAVAGFYTPDESRTVAYEVAERFCGFTRAQAVADPCAEAPCYESLLAGICRQLAEGRPLQYVVGSTEFCGLQLSVEEGVLIPRPETEELVSWIVEEYFGRQGLRFLDIGTGSGAIAISLAHMLAAPRAEAVDVSEEALRIAEKNAQANEVQVKFAEADILDISDRMPAFVREGGYDFIVSNPPYIPLSEYTTLRDNVRLYEPSVALFVDDADPLLFYREIGKKSMQYLARNGRLFFEIHERFSQAVCMLLSSIGFGDITCREDINGKPRMVRCMKK